MSDRINLGPRIVVALDFPTAAEAIEMSRRLDPALCRLKVGFELYIVAGPSLIERLQKDGFEVFLDLKFHDIPNTVASACRAAAGLGVWMVNVHASGGQRMMEAARLAIDSQQDRPKLIAVTVLTSMETEELNRIGVERDAAEQVRHLAGLAKSCGLDGVVCSAHEAAQLKADNGEDFCLVTPGIRPAEADAGDQRRIMTPDQAISAGSHYLVIGRPITRSENPVERLQQISITLPI